MSRDRVAMDVLLVWRNVKDVSVCKSVFEAGSVQAVLSRERDRIYDPPAAV